MSENDIQRTNKQLIVDNPILNDPFEEPTRHWDYDTQTKHPRKEDSRRDAHYYFRARMRKDAAQTSLLADEEEIVLEPANTIRAEVKKWRERGYNGASPITRRLLRHWNDPDRERRLFFCQREAVETIIWLTEVKKKNIGIIDIPKDRPNEDEFSELTRYAVKMATGSGKTLVMAMIIAWSVLNKVNDPRANWCSKAVLIVGYNLTVKERLGGAPKSRKTGEEPERALISGAKGNYYDKFDLVPAGLKEQLGQAKIMITNWHRFTPLDDRKKRGARQRGEESALAFTNRVLRDMGPVKNILVLNDEAHHAYRPVPLDESDEKVQKLTAQEKEDKEKAKVWVSGLDRINKARGINFCVDLSATPFYNQSSGYIVGSPFRWIVSDFGLADAIECGIVKIPQVPVAHDSGRLMPEYFALWRWINERLPAKERATGRRKPKPESILREADGALQQLAGQWKERLENFEEEGRTVPPCMIIVCDNTNISELVHEYISGEKWEEYIDEKGKKRKRRVYGTGRVFSELLDNTSGVERTVRIDSKLLDEAEFRDEGASKQDAKEALRRKIATVGKEGEPGEQVRCVVSVGMLTEGWDAQNVTQILGLRAFESQLLCEQVVGRGLRRTQYNDFTVPEYVDVYGIPFEVIPVKKKPVGPGTQPKPTTLVKTLPDREHLKIEFPRVEGFVYQVKSRITAEIDKIEKLSVEPNVEPTETIVSARIGYQIGSPGMVGPGETVTQTRAGFYENMRPQQIHYEIARRITTTLLQSADFKIQSRQLLFPQVLQIVREYVKPYQAGGRVEYNDVDEREIGLEKYIQQIVERLCTAIRPDERVGEAPLLPRLERFRPRGSTSEVLFRTSRPCKPTVKSHINHVVLDTHRWESSAAFYLEQSDLVTSYARNDHLEFTIDYEFNGSQHTYTPDYLVKLADGTTLVLEIKGYEDEQTRAKHEAARRWCESVSNWVEMGRWEFRVCKDPKQIKKILNEMIREKKELSGP